MKDAHDHLSNASTHPTLWTVVQHRFSRRQVLHGGLLTAGLSLSSGVLQGRGRSAAAADSPLLGFKGVPVSMADTVTVPEGYRATVLYAWGDTISDGPTFKPDASNTVADQEQQAGMHHDGMHFFPLPLGSQNAARGLLAINHEYTDDGLLHIGGMEPWTADKVAKSQAAHGVSIIEVALTGDTWTVVRPSSYARRLTGRTPMGFSGPAAGHALLHTATDPAGQQVLGTLNNCAMGATPWGTYLTCEENFNGYFVNTSGNIPAMHKRYGINDKGSGYRWHEHDERFDAAKHPNEPNRFGWVLEIDPFAPNSQPVKHTALGRFKHEGAMVTLATDNRVVVYMGDDERNEYIYKFVSSGTYDPNNRQANMRLLDQGTLYVARFNADGTGEWRALVQGQQGLEAAVGFSSQAEVVTYARAAADKVGATKMDRPEWIAVHGETTEVYCALTNNTARGTDKGPPTDAANPRANNAYGHIIRWREQKNQPQATTFRWDIFVLSGDPQNSDADKRGTIKGDIFGSPDGLWFDPRGVLWIQTDVSMSTLNKGDYANMGNNQMLAANVHTGEIRRFLTGPRGCEITGIVTTPDGTSMFINIQHPGETAGERSDPAQPTAVSTWPNDGRPRSATVVIRKQDGGVIGT